jgi:hypothetical protein
MQYNRTDDGHLEPLKNKNIDTGLGLERMAQILQQVMCVCVCVVHCLESIMFNSDSLFSASQHHVWVFPWLNHKCDRKPWHRFLYNNFPNFFCWLLYTDYDHCWESWQLVTAIHDEIDTCEWHGKSYNLPHFCDISFGFSGLTLQLPSVGCSGFFSAISVICVCSIRQVENHQKGPVPAGCTQVPQCCLL